MHLIRGMRRMTDYLENGNSILAEGEIVLCRLCGSECFELLFRKEEFRIERCANKYVECA